MTALGFASSGVATGQNVPVLAWALLAGIAVAVTGTLVSLRRSL